MERIETIITETKIKYVAVNGKEFDTQEECENYEYALEHIEDILSKIIFFKEKNGIFTQINIDKLGWFDYCYLIDDTYVKYHKYLTWNVKYKNQLEDFHDIKHIGFYHRDYSNAYSGGYGSNGWYYIGTSEKIKLWENLRKALDK